MTLFSGELLLCEKDEQTVREWERLHIHTNSTLQTEHYGRIHTSGMLSITFNVTHRERQTTEGVLWCWSKISSFRNTEFLLLYSSNGLNKSSRLNHIIFINYCERNSLNHILNISSMTAQRSVISRSLHLYSKKQRVATGSVRFQKNIKYRDAFHPPFIIHRLSCSTANK